MKTVVLLNIFVGTVMHLSVFDMLKEKKKLNNSIYFKNVL